MSTHSRSGYAQLTHHGRAAIPQFAGHVPVSALATPVSTEEKYPHRPPFAPKDVSYEDSLVAYWDHPPVALSVEGIQQTIEDYACAAGMAMGAGFDGVEIHAGNGYLVDQFPNSNVSRRDDAYEGSLEKRCTFELELLKRVGDRIGTKNVAIRLSPFGFYNDMRDDSRYETWSHLLQQIKVRCPDISYVHFVEPRHDEVNENQDFASSWDQGRPVDLVFAHKTLHPIPIISRGGWNAESCWSVVESERTVDACAFARWFISNPDLMERLRSGRLLTPYDRQTFYGPVRRREVGYTEYPVWKDHDCE